MGPHCLAQQQQPHALHKVPYSTYTPVTQLAGYDVAARNRQANAHYINSYQQHMLVQWCAPGPGGTLAKVVK